MPNYVSAPSKEQIRPTIEKLSPKISDLDVSRAVFGASQYSIACELFNEKMGVSMGKGHQLIRLLSRFDFEPYVKAGLFYSVTGCSKYKMKEPFISLFFYEPNKGFSLTTQGIEARSWWVTSLRRVLQDHEIYYERMFGRHSKEGRAKAFAAKRFFKLSEPEQIAVLREYWAMPFRTKEEKLARKRARIEIRLKYDLINWDLINVVQKFGDVVKSVRKHPDIAHMFPAWKKPAPSQLD
jgi:hypothetical protein